MSTHGNARTLCFFSSIVTRCVYFSFLFLLLLRCVLLFLGQPPRKRLERDRKPFLRFVRFLSRALHLFFIFLLFLLPYLFLDSSHALLLFCLHGLPRFFFNLFCFVFLQFVQCIASVNLFGKSIQKSSEY
jgi:hypothetical protein